MKKQHIILSTLVCLFISLTVQAQNNPIDLFLKKYSSREGVTNVSVSQQMLQSIFASSEQSSSRISTARTSPAKASKPAPAENAEDQSSMKFAWTVSPSTLNVPEAYSSVTVSKAEKPADMFADFRKVLVSSKYEPYMEVNKEENNVLSYFLKKVNDNNNEIIVLRQQKEQFSAIYIKGDIDINKLDQYLSRIRSSLARLGAGNHMEIMSHPVSDWALSSPVLNDIRFNLNNNDFKYQFDMEAMQRNIQESMKTMEETMENVKKEMKTIDIKVENPEKEAI